MKKLINVIALAVLVAAGAQASIIITLDNPDQAGIPGETLSFTGTITNTDSNLSDPDIFLNSDDINFALTDASVNDNFFADFPTGDLPSDTTSVDMDLFDITITNPESLPLGTFAGIYTVYGGADGGADTASDNLAQTNFSVTVTPEPATFALLGLGLPLIGWVRRRRTGRTAARHL